jgi:predicted RNase H-like HicB family nuclease
MGTTTDQSDEEGVEFLYEEGLVTARDIESGVAASGETKAAALSMLAEALTLHEGGGGPIDDGDEFLRESGIDPEAIDTDDSPPPWLE